MTNTIVRARIDEQVKEEAAAVVGDYRPDRVRCVPPDDDADCQGQGASFRAFGTQ